MPMHFNTQPPLIQEISHLRVKDNLAKWAASTKRHIVHIAELDGVVTIRSRQGGGFPYIAAAITSWPDTQQIVILGSKPAVFVTITRTESGWQMITAFGSAS